VHLQILAKTFWQIIFLLNFSENLPKSQIIKLFFTKIVPLFHMITLANFRENFRQDFRLIPIRYYIDETSTQIRN
jgi:hypothetical protein